MNENLDLTKILNGCPEGTEFYHTVYGRVYFSGIKTNLICPIRFTFIAFNKSRECGVTCKGLHSIYYNGECILFPSKDQRDWSKFERFWDKPKVKKFDPKTLQPFDKVLVKRCGLEDKWMCNIFSFYDEGTGYDFECLDDVYENCIPYNEETKHLVGTTKDCPEYYKWWEE